MNAVERQLKRMIKDWEYELNHGTPFENYFGKNHWTKRLQTKNWQVDITNYRNRTEFDIYAVRPGTSSVDYSTFINQVLIDDFPGLSSDARIRLTDKHLADLLEMYDDFMFEELMEHIQTTYYEYPEDREE